MTEKYTTPPPVIDDSVPSAEAKLGQELHIEVASSIIPLYDPCQDAVLVASDLGLGGVFDGLGGSAQAEIASTTAVDAIENHYHSEDDPHDLEAAKKLLYFALVRADEEIKNFAQTLKSDETPQTTASVAKLWRDPTSGDYKLLAASSGDSRVYLLDPEGNLHRITVDNVDDNTLDEEVVQARAEQDRLSGILDPENAADEKHFKTRHIVYHALGRPNEDLEPRIEVTDVTSGCKVLLTSDGVHDNLTDDEIRELLAAPDSSENLAESITKAAKNRSAYLDFARSKPDDISAVVLVIS